MSGWHGVDLDGTLAIYNGWQGENHIGPPVPLMLARVKRWLANGEEVKILTARVSDPRRGEDARKVIEQWCLEHVGVVLPVTDRKDSAMIDIWDDRAVQVEANTGRRMDGTPEPEGPP